MSSPRNCKLDWFKTKTDCNRKITGEQVEQYAKECGINTSVYNTKPKRCEQLMLLKNKKNKASSKKASSKKASSKKASSKKASSKKASSPDDYEDDFEPLSPRKASSRKASSRKASSRKASSPKRSCNLDWFTSERDCIRTKTLNAQQVEQQAQDCGIDTKKHTTRVDRCKQLNLLKKEKSPKRRSPKKSPKKRSPRKRSPRKASPPKEPSDCDLSWYIKKNSCLKDLNSQQVREHAIKCGIDINVYKTKKAQCEALHDKQYPYIKGGMFDESDDEEEEIEKSVKIAKNNEEKVEEKSCGEAPISSSTPLQLPCTIYKNISLKEHQTKVCKHIMKNPTQKGMILFHSVGSGKTLTSITIIRCLKSIYPEKKVFVITPKSLVDNFKKELVKADNTHYDDLHILTHVAFTNDVKANGVKKYKDAILIVDEAHNFKTVIAPPTRKRRTWKGTRAIRLFRATRKASHVFLLTATPLFNRPIDIANLYAAISNNEDKIKEIYSYFDPTNLHTERDFEQMFKNKISYFKNVDSSDYPRVTYHKMSFPMTPEYQEKYELLEKPDYPMFLNNLNTVFKRLEFDEDEYDNDAIIPNKLLSFFTGVRRAVNAIEKDHPTPKIIWAFEKIKENVKKNQKTLFYSNWIDSGLELLQKMLVAEGIPFVSINGDMSIKQRQEAVLKYNSNEVMVFTVSAAGTEGLDLKETRAVIILESHWNIERINQVIGRAVRYKSHQTLPEADRHVDIYNLLLVKSNGGSIDNELYDMSEDKNYTNNQFYEILKKVAI
jgi:SNF2 family DNA or RNA helicase